MASGNDTRLSASECLRGADNYYQWKSRVYNILEGKGLEEFIELTCTVPDPVKPVATIKTPVPTNQATLVVTSSDQVARALEIKAWKMNDGRAKTTIQANCATEPNDLIADINTASEMWSVLKEHYQGRGQSLKAKCLKEIQQIQCSNYDTITSFIVAFNRLHMTLNGVGMNMPVGFYTLTFIEAMNSAYPVWAERWSHTARDATQTITLAALYQDITDEARRQENRQNRMPNNGSNRNNVNGNANSGSQDKPKCGYCNKIGHREDECFNKFPRKKEAYYRKMKTQRNRRRKKL